MFFEAHKTHKVGAGCEFMLIARHSRRCSLFARRATETRPGAEPGRKSPGSGQNFESKEGCWAQVVALKGRGVLLARVNRLGESGKFIKKIVEDFNKGNTGQNGTLGQ